MGDGEAGGGAAGADGVSLTGVVDVEPPPPPQPNKAQHTKTPIKGVMTRCKHVAMKSPPKNLTKSCYRFIGKGV